MEPIVTFNFTATQIDIGGWWSFFQQWRRASVSESFDGEYSCTIEVDPDRPTWRIVKFYNAVIPTTVERTYQDAIDVLKEAWKKYVERAAILPEGTHAHKFNTDRASNMGRAIDLLEDKRNV